MASYNVKSAIDLGWNPNWFGAKKFGSELIDKISEFQTANDLKPDGFCGPKTFKILKKNKPRGNFIVCGTKHIAISNKVVLWTDEKKGLKAKKNCYRENYDSRDVRTFVNHWDVCLNSKSCISILNNRKLSCHFLIDYDGTIYQTMNTSHIAWHAGGKSWNKYSIGVEINNPYYTKYQDKKNPRPLVRGAKVHGRTMSEHLDFYPIQIDALKKLWVAVSMVYGIPFVTPTNKDGTELATIHKKSINNLFRGFIHHYNLTAGKIDCGGLDLTKLIHDIKYM